jgi:hypothetical protein
MRYFAFIILMLFVLVNSFSQNNLEKSDIIKNKFVELINAYDENPELTENDDFQKIFHILKYVFIENGTSIRLIVENNLNKIYYSSNNITVEIMPRFAPMHLTGSFTYCTGKISFDNLFYDFYLYEYNKYSWDYNEAKINNNLSFCYFDINEENYAYFNIFKPKEYELFIMNKYQNVEYFLERPDCKILTKIIYNN